MKGRISLLVYGLTLLSAGSLLIAACTPVDTSPTPGGLGTEAPGGLATALPTFDATALPEGTALGEATAIGEATALPEATAIGEETALPEATAAGEETAVGEATALPEATAVGEATAIPETGATALPEEGGGTAVAGEPRVEVFEIPTLVDAPVMNEAGEEVGVITDFVLDLEDGQLPYVILMVTGLPGLESATIPVPWEYFEIQSVTETPEVVLNVDNETLAEAPAVDLETWPREAGMNWDADIQAYWSTIPAAQ